MLVCIKILFFTALVVLIFTTGCQNEIKRKKTDEPFTLDCMYKHPESHRVMMDIYTKAFQSWPTPDTSRFIGGRFGKTYVIQWGSPANDTLVLLHGVAGNVMLWGKECIEQLSKQFYIIAIETMGDNVGRSIPNQWPLKRDTLRYWIDELLDSMQLSSVHLVGHSFGGWLALDYALHCQQRVRSLSLLGAAGFCKPKIGFMCKLMYLTIRNTKRSMEKAYSLLHTPQFNTQSHDFEYFMEVYRHCKQPTLYPRRFSPEELSGLNLPIIIVIGNDENFYDVKKAEQWGKQNIPHSKIHLIDNAGHLAHMDRSEAVCSLIADFIK